MKKIHKTNFKTIGLIPVFGILLLSLIVLNSCEDSEPAKEVPPFFLTKIFGGAEYDFGFSVTHTTDGGSILAGDNTSDDGDFSGLNNGKSDIFVIKLNSDGEKEWTKTYGGSGNDGCYSIIQTQDGGFALTGGSNSNDGDFSDLNHDSYDIFVMKLSFSGEVQWVKNFGGSEYESGISIVQTLDAGFVLTGLFESNDGDFKDLNGGGPDTFVMKLSSDGEMQWVTSFGGELDEYGNSIIRTQDGGFVVIGASNSDNGDFDGLNKGLQDIFVIKVNSTGTKQWIKTFGGSNFDRGYSVIQINDGGFILTGYSSSNDGDFANTNKGGDDIVLIKVNSLGEKQWSKSFGGSDDEIGVSIIQTQNGEIVLTGPTYSNDGDFNEMNKGEADIFILTVNSSGKKQSLWTLGGSGMDKSWFLSPSQNDDYILTGQSDSSDGDFADLDDKGESDILFIKAIH